MLHFLLTEHDISLIKITEYRIWRHLVRREEGEKKKKKKKKKKDILIATPVDDMCMHLYKDELLFDTFIKHHCKVFAGDYNNKVILTRQF